MKGRYRFVRLQCLTSLKTIMLVVTAMKAFTVPAAHSVKLNGDTVWSFGWRLTFAGNRLSPSIGQLRSLVLLTSVVVPRSFDVELPSYTASKHRRR
jgi:hypothetical protein